MKIHKAKIHFTLLLSALFIHTSGVHGAMFWRLAAWHKMFVYLGVLTNVTYPNADTSSRSMACHILGVHETVQQPLYEILQDFSPYDHYLITPCDENYNYRNESLCINALRVITEPLCEHTSCRKRNVYSIENIPDETLIRSNKLSDKTRRAASIRTLLKSKMPSNAQVYIEYEIPPFYTLISKISQNFYRDTLLREITREILRHPEGRLALLPHGKLHDLLSFLQHNTSRIIVDGGVTSFELFRAMEWSLYYGPQGASDHQALRNIHHIQERLNKNNDRLELSFGRDS